VIVLLSSSLSAGSRRTKLASASKLVVRPSPAGARKVELKRLDPGIAIGPRSSLMPVTPPGGD
jgi:hypothetical protein